MEFSLYDRLPAPGASSAEESMSLFLGWVEGAKLKLYPAQEEAILEIYDGKNVILNTPTGSGKSLVATAAHFLAMSEGKRSFYTCPIKALVNEKFFALCREFGADHVGMITGDASVNHEAPIICCTAEILANMALRDGENADADYVIMDEFHYYADRDRGVAWQIPLLTMKKARFLLMSATLGDTSFFEKKITELTGVETVLVKSYDRPVPLDFEYRETALHETILDLSTRGQVPVYLVNFTQRACAEEAQNLMSTDFCTKDEKRAILEALHGVRFPSPYGKEIQRFLKHGIGIHHAGLLPRYRLLVEKLAQKGLLKVISGTDTLGVGVNIPIRTVLFTRLCKYDGQKTAILSVRDFQQISGRAGRRGFDTQGTVMAQAPEHVVENLRLEAKAGNDPLKKKRITRKKPPEKGYAHWDRKTFDRLVTSAPEPLPSRFQVTHGMLMEVLGRPNGGCRAMKQLVRDSHDTPAQKRAHKKHALLLLRSLVGAGIIQFVPREDGFPGKVLRINADLQSDFSLHQTLSLYLHDTIPLLDRESPDYALDLLTLVESILENPDLVLMKQLDALKTEVLAELKAKGVEYDDRMAELEKLEYPKPQREFIYGTFNDFARKHPWVGQENIRPKSIAREMIETFQSFPDYIKEYDLQRAEGLLLRYLSDVYKVLARSVPDAAKTPEVDEVIIYLGALVRGVDSSLLDEWERLANRTPDEPLLPRPIGDDPRAPADVTRDTKAFTAMVRNEMWRFLRFLARKDYAAAAQMVSSPSEPSWTGPRIEAEMAPWYEAHAEIRLDAAARDPKNTRVTVSADGEMWRVEQVICDEEGVTGACVTASIDLGVSRDLGKPFVILERIGE